MHSLLLENNKLLFGETELSLGGYSLFISNVNFDFVKRTFETNVTRLLMPHKNKSLFSNFSSYVRCFCTNQNPIKI